MQCGSCAGSLIFDPVNGKLVCKSCGGVFEVSHTNDRGLVDINSVFQDKDEITKEDINVYTCNTCGGSIIVNDVEMTSACPFCGNNGVIFDRVAKRRRPDFIIPFSFDAKSAEEKSQRASERIFFPDEKSQEYDSRENCRNIYSLFHIICRKQK